MTKAILPIANGFYKSGSLPISAQECVNWYPNIVSSPALNQETLLGTPGISLLATSGEINMVNRGARTFRGVPYFVNGENLYRLSLTVVGGIDTFQMEDMGVIGGEGRVYMSDNGIQLFILVPGGDGFIFTVDPDLLTTITDVDFKANGNPKSVLFLDGYFVLTTDENKFIISSLNDGLSYNALDFGTAESNPDDIVSPVVFRNQLFISGSQTLEAFQNIGTADFPFQRTGLFVEKGVSAQFSVINADNTFMFIGAGKNESPAIWAFEGNTVVKISTTAIDTILSGVTKSELSDVFAWSYAQNGAYFVAFTLPDTTIVIDTTTGLWHERKSQIVTKKDETKTQRFRVNSVVSAYGRIIAGDSIDGRVGSISPETYREYNSDIIRVAATQPFQNNMDSFFVPAIELTMESGVGNNDVADPKIRMSISTNGGKTFKSERTRLIGKAGEYGHRTIWRRNGRASRFAIFKFTLSDAVKPVIIQLTADITQ